MEPAHQRLEDVNVPALLLSHGRHGPDGFEDRLEGRDGAVLLAAGLSGARMRGEFRFEQGDALLGVREQLQKMRKVPAEVVLQGGLFGSEGRGATGVDGLGLRVGGDGALEIGVAGAEAGEVFLQVLAGGEEGLDVVDAGLGEVGVQGVDEDAEVFGLDEDPVVGVFEVRAGAAAVLVLFLVALDEGGEGAGVEAEGVEHAVDVAVDLFDLAGNAGLGDVADVVLVGEEWGEGGGSFDFRVELFADLLVFSVAKGLLLFSQSSRP